MNSIPPTHPTVSTPIPGGLTLRAPELCYQRLFEVARDGIMILDLETGRVVEVNPSLIEMLGFSHGELVGKTWGELGAFKTMEPESVLRERLQKEDRVIDKNLSLETKAGRKIAVEFSGNICSAGERAIALCHFRELPEPSAVEKEQSRLAAIIESSGDAIVSKTVDGIVIGWNHGAEKQYGYTAEEMIGHSISVLFPPDHYQEYQRIMKKLKRGEPMTAFDTVRQRKDGTLVNVSVWMTPIEARDGKIVGASKHSHDITRIKKLEAQIIEAQKMEVVGQLAGGVAHDFNNILAVILGYTGLIMGGLGPDHALLKYLEEIRHASERAAGLTRQLLVFSRKQTVQPLVIDLNAVVGDIETMLRRLIDENIGMTIIPGKQIGNVKADPGYVGQVLMNLIVNARDAMPDGGQITITTAKVTLSANDASAPTGATPGDYVMLTVSDTGTGMTDEVKAHMFEAFFTTKPKGKGTGLGLATCQTIIQQSGGYIRVESEAGKGAAFQIYFPRTEQPLDVAARPLPAGPLPRGTETLLVVEDEPSVRQLARSVLAAQGYKVLLASNGQEALHVVHEHKAAPISLVVTDVIMPLMSGKVMVEWLKTTYPDLKILFTSGYTDEAIAHHGVLDAGIEFLPKPYTPATLSRKVRAMLDAPQTLATHEQT